MDDDKLQDLKTLLDKNLQGFHEKWAGMSPAELVEASREITAIRDAYEYLTEDHWFEPEEVALFLQSENPLKRDHGAAPLCRGIGEQDGQTLRR